MYFALLVWLRNCNQERSDNHQEGYIEKYMHTTKILASDGVCIVSMDCKYWHFNFVVCTGSSSDIGIYFFLHLQKLLCIKIQLYIKKPTKDFVHQNTVVHVVSPELVNLIAWVHL